MAREVSGSSALASLAQWTTAMTSVGPNAKLAVNER
jgi:hypothetical protein